MSDDAPPAATALPVYLDYNATTPLSECVVAAMQPFMVAGVSSTLFGNPSSSHVYGASARRALEQARRSIATCIGAEQSSEVVLLGSATESLNYALLGAARAQRARGRGAHLISCAIEHVATLAILEQLQREGFRVTLLPVDSEGRVSAAQVAAAIQPDTVLVSIMLANNEVGSVLPVGEIAAAIRSTPVSDGHSIWLHTDASQALGKIPVDVRELDVDLLTVAGHKIYASKGVGALYVRAATVQAQGGLAKHMIGANHENDRRAGTENVMLVAGLGAACDAITAELPALMRSFTQLRDELQESIRSNMRTLLQEHGLHRLYTCDPVPPASSSAAAVPTGPTTDSPRHAFLIHGSIAHRLTNTLSIGFHSISATELLGRLQAHVAASAGAACHSDTVSLSYVLQAMNVPREFGMGTLRLSVGRYNTMEEMRRVGRLIAQTVVQMWGEQQRAAVAKVNETAPYTTLQPQDVQDDGPA